MHLDDSDSEKDPSECPVWERLNMRLWICHLSLSPCSVSQGPEGPWSPAEGHTLAEGPGTRGSAAENAALPPLGRSPDEEHMQSSMLHLCMKTLAKPFPAVIVHVEYEII